MLINKFEELINNKSGKHGSTKAIRKYLLKQYSYKNNLLFYIAQTDTGEGIEKVHLETK